MELFLPQTKATRCSSRWSMPSSSRSRNSTTGLLLSARGTARPRGCSPSSSLSSSPLSAPAARPPPTFTRDFRGGLTAETTYWPSTVPEGASRGSGMWSGCSERGCRDTKYFTVWYQEASMSGASGCSSSSSSSTSMRCGRCSCSRSQDGGFGGVVGHGRAGGPEASEAGCESPVPSSGSGAGQAAAGGLKAGRAAWDAKDVACEPRGATDGREGGGSPCAL
mmetsp:Transcript_93626/g.291360  ORF Transcript_93626/g.291360 Transcript_93626/m.291360 type:complete len:222 (-) Transcript_93626:24-689(-)